MGVTLRVPTAGMEPISGCRLMRVASLMSQVSVTDCP